jgi:hypothetical protein
MQRMRFSTVVIEITGVVFIIIGVLANNGTVWTAGAIAYAVVAILASTAMRT